ncbi:hypothetical protein ERJ75_000596600 [Trypanosoma vivax]|nr:hypothetical protein ERJ75_000596600 [Trypanosoma vivax]
MVHGQSRCPAVLVQARSRTARKDSRQTFHVFCLDQNQMSDLPGSAKTGRHKRDGTGATQPSPGERTSLGTALAPADHCVQALVLASMCVGFRRRSSLQTQGDRGDGWHPTDYRTRCVPAAFLRPKNGAWLSGTVMYFSKPNHLTTCKASSAGSLMHQRVECAGRLRYRHI